MQPHPLREMFADHSCKNCRYPERGCTRYMCLNTCQEFQPNDDAIFREIVRLKIAHLRRMVNAIRLVLDRHLISAETEAEFERKKWHRNNRAGRFAKACLAKITELKELQCSTKS